MIKHALISALLICVTCSAIAQTRNINDGVDVKDGVATQTTVSGMTDETATGYSPTLSARPIYQPDYTYPAIESLDTLHLPRLNSHGQVMPIMHPLWYGSFWGGWNSWGLHEGLNVSLGASVFAQFGKGAHGGAGFAQSISAMYAMSLTNHLSVAIGGYFNNINWGNDNTRNAGLSAVLGYQFDKHWEAYLYAQKSLMTSGNYMPRYMYDAADINDRIGAAVKYNFSPSFSVQLSVERDSRPLYAPQQQTDRTRQH